MMFTINEQDREYIENKYHFTSQPFSPYNFRAYHGGEYDLSTGLSDEKMKEGLRKIAEQFKDKEHALSKAKQIEFVLDNTPVDVNEKDWFVGIYSWTRITVPTTSDIWKEEVFQKENAVKEAIDSFRALNLATIYPDYDHSIPDWDAVIALGFKGLLDRVKLYRQKNDKIESDALFDAMEIVYSAILRLLKRLEEYALSHPSKKSELQARCLKSLQNGAPTDTYEALQLIYLYHLIGECVDCYQVRSLASGLDRTLTPFYRNDLKTKRYDEEQLRSFIGYFLLQYNSMHNYWGQPTYLGGSNEKGECIVNEVSHTILSVYDDLGVYNPKIQIKLTPTTPVSFINKALDMIRRNKGSIVFVGETGTVKAMERYGVSREDALTCDISGCYELHLRGGEIVTLGAYINLAQPLLYLLDGLKNESVRALFEIDEIDITTLDTFEKFTLAYEKVFEKMMIKVRENLDATEKYLSTINPSVVFTATIENALKMGVDAYQEGVKHNNTGIFCCGFATAVDSLCAVNELVYKRKLISLQDLNSLLKREWEGGERLRLIAKNSKHKYGNNDAFADEIAKRVYDDIILAIAGKKNARGGVYKTLMHTALYYLHYGESTPATPDGRRRGEEVSKNATPSVGADRQGATALVLSALNLEPSLCTEDFCVDIMLHPSACEGEDGLDAMRSLLTVYEKRGGLAIQFNVMSGKLLRNAQKEPEKYKNLQVRVCGWNVLWNNLSLAEQNAYIERAENVI